MALLIAAMFALAASAGAREPRSRSHLRTVHGSVLDRKDNPLPNGVVYLRNKRNNVIRTYIADSSGHYRFSGLDPNADYEIQAKYKQASSARHTISSFDDRRDIEINLIIGKRK